ncbi:OmpA family protein [Sphingomonas sp. 37zxx]|uniref:OmpA family protein n=1 Tax=Sphingomonas sp. 37zxx TaxID=1550073 RepID=UPI00068BF964|nr:OmpA family protein [Sphingomonas sp. 37zxx]
MTLRSMFPLLLLPLSSACDRPAPPPAAPKDNAAREAQPSQSIMQPKVIAEIKPAPAPVATPEPVRLPETTIAFAAGAALDQAGRTALDALLADPALPDAARYVLRGSSDSQGSDADNLATARRRAQAVRAYLVEQGVAADRITVIALGEHRPVAPNATLDGADDPAGRARNRRVDVEVLAPTTQAEPTPDLPAATDRAEP